MINIYLVENLAKVSRKERIEFVIYFIDFVFDGVKNSENIQEDKINPIFVYEWIKA